MSDLDPFAQLLNHIVSRSDDDRQVFRAALDGINQQLTEIRKDLTSKADTSEVLDHVRRIEEIIAATQGEAGELRKRVDMATWKVGLIWTGIVGIAVAFGWWATNGFPGWLT